MNGFRLQLAPVASELARHHEVVVLAYRWPEQTGAAPPGVELHTIDRPRRSVLRRGLTWLTSPLPLGAATTTGPMAAAAHRLLTERGFDVLHVAGWSLAGLADELPALPRVLTAFDANHLNYQAESDIGSFLRRWAYAREAKRVVRFERSAYAGFNSVVVVTREDADALRRLDPRLSLEVAPNGVDADVFAPRRDIAPESGLIVMTGAMQWGPNIAAATFLAREVFPLVRAARPDARVALVGRRPGAQVRALNELDGVTVTGDVPDIRDWLWRAQVFACPMMSGTGIKNKLLEALACGVPSVATPLACQGMEVVHERELLVADTADEIASEIVRLLDDPPLRERLGAGGRSHVVARHSWESVAGLYERLLREAQAQPARG